MARTGAAALHVAHTGGHVGKGVFFYASVDLDRGAGGEGAGEDRDIDGGGEEAGTTAVAR